MKKTIVNIFLLILFIIPLTACSHAGSPSSGPAPVGAMPTPGVEAFPSSSPTENAGDTSPSVVQPGLPLTVTEPADGATINDNTVTVKGKTVPKATVTVNDQANVADDNGNFSIPLTLAEGPNFLDITALDNNGNRGEIILMVNADLSQASSAPGISESPSDTIPLEVTSPADGATLNTADIVVKGQTAAGAVVIVNDQVEIADEQGNFSIPISLENGINVIDVTASDDNGNQAEVILMVNVM